MSSDCCSFYGVVICIFVGYSLPIELMVIAVLADSGAPRLWELILVFAVLVVFNRIGAHIPTYDEGNWDGMTDFYGGFGVEIRLRSVLRFAEIWAYVGAFYLLRKAASRTSWGPRAGLVL